MKKLFNNIILVCKDGLKQDSEIIHKIKSIANTRKLIIIPYSEADKTVLDSADLVITLGGDGTFIRAANIIDKSFIIGINSNPKSSEGALSSLTISNIDILKGVLDGNYEVINRTRIKVVLNGRVLPETATNEVYIGTELQFHTSRYKIKFNGFSEEHRSSGVVVSTGTGSKSWYSAIGGKPFSPDEKILHFIVREPYFGDKVFKPTIINGIINSDSSLTIESTRNFGGIIAINDVIYKFNSGDIAEFSVSDKPVRCLIPK